MSQRKFDSLTLAGQRVRIARDVIDQLTTRKIRAKTGVYLSLGRIEDVVDFDDKSVQEVLEKTKCEACALGSLFVASVRIKNGLLASESLDETTIYVQDGSNSRYEDIVTCDNSVMRERLAEYFDDEQVDLIESAFETADMGDDDNLEQIEDAIAFGQKHINPTRRMKAIMQNIVDHRGTFTP